ncbi:hypothetical protein [Aeromicrobium sp.]|uniref:hypothetical protein n=1 Tax=Aeromicrobium sp. TaxID=1871063 RepID=UPI0019B60D43|nr:hypothetical protein [Aeromicrobium sp.]MBC7630621.1 hypothetical protein [Aeromicrobium sp.]
MRAMRWERLFTDLEAQADDVELAERDDLIDELRDGEWAATSWRAMLGGHVALDVRGAGRVDGETVLVNEHVVQLRGGHVDHVISSRAVLSIISSESRGEVPTAVTAALGWGHVLRALRDEGEAVRLCLVDGSTKEGMVTAVGTDFVRVAAQSHIAETGAGHLVPFEALAMASGRS